MKMISINREGRLTNQAKFDTEEKASGWLNSCLAKNKFGLPERPELGENGKETGKILPAEFEVVIEDYETPVEEKRKAAYQKEIDPGFQEAVMDFMAGKSEKSDALLAKYEAIKLQHPKVLKVEAMIEELEIPVEKKKRERKKIQ